MWSEGFFITVHEARVFSYRLEFPDFSMVYSGDFGYIDDFASPLGDGCDLFLAETGRHKVKDLCDFAESHSLEKLLFYHHGMKF